MASADVMAITKWPISDSEIPLARFVVLPTRREKAPAS
jgi:hypothetical protein